MWPAVRRAPCPASGRSGPLPPEACLGDAVPPAAADPQAVTRIEADLKAAGLALLNAAALEPNDADALTALRTQGKAVRVSGQLYGEATAIKHAAD